MNRPLALLPRLVWLPLVLLSAGCASPFYADRGAGLGALTGGAAGAAIGHGSGNPLLGAAVGAGLGALGGQAIGAGIDRDVARREQMIAEQLGRPLVGAATQADVVAMTAAGLNEGLIIGHLQTHGVAEPPTAADIIHLHQQGVSDTVLQAMQTEANRPAAAPAPPPIFHAPPRPPTIVVEEYYHFGPPRYRRHPSYYW